jgi:uncharacterized protein (UPF0332 family)
MIEPLDYLPFARELLDKSTEEIRIRTAVSRSYYAVYLYAANKYGQAKGSDPEIIRSHAKLISELKKEQSKLLNKIGNQLFDLKKDREKVDYEIKNDINKSFAEKSYSQAIRIKESVDKAFSSSSPNSLTPHP